VKTPPVKSASTEIAVYGLLAVFALLFLISLPGRSMQVDDAWLGEQAYWLSQDGYVRSELFRGPLGYEEGQMVYHKLFIMIGAAAIRIFGWSLYVLKDVSLLFYAIFVLTSYIYFQRNRDRFTRGDFWVFNLLMISMPLTFKYAYIFRPEITVMALGFLSFHFLTQGLKARSAEYCALAGVLAGLGLLTHLNGWTLILAGTVLLAANRRYRLAFIFGVSACAVSLLYLYNLTSAENLKLFRDQISKDPAMEHMDFSVWRNVLKAAYEHQRFFHSPKEIFTSVVLALSLVFSWRELTRRHRDLLVYLVTLVVALAIFSRPRPTYYMLIYMPYIFLTVTIALKNRGGMGAIRRNILLAAAALYFAYGLYYAAGIIQARNGLPKANREIAAYVAPGSRVAAPVSFIYNEICNYRIQGLTLYAQAAHHEGIELTGETLFQMARAYDNAYVILDDEYIDLLGLAGMTEGGSIGDYVLIRAMDHALVFAAAPAQGYEPE
jgi:uncharacterized membrane protein YbaN (DUF454 family)